MIHREFSVNNIDELTSKRIAEAMEYLAGKVLVGELLPKESNSIPLPPTMPTSGPGRTMLYIDEKGVVQGSYPLDEDQVVMSFDGFVNYIWKKEWVVLPRDEVAKGLLGAVDSLH